MDVDNVNTKSAKMTIAGWLAGLAYYSWFSSTAAHLPVWQHALLIVVGMFAAAIIIGGGMALVAAGLTRAITGRSDGSLNAYAWAAFISPVLAFFAAKYVLLLLAPSAVEAASIRQFQCDEPLPLFTLGEMSNPSDKQITELCGCMWSKLPVNGWEREVSAQIRAGEDPGWRGRGFMPRFGGALEECGGMSL